jgi:hypothetical protein
MADYFTPTVVQQTIPHDDITPLEVILLSHVFTGEAYEQGWYFYADQAARDLLTIARRELEDGWAASRHTPSESNALVEKLLAEQPDATEIEIDLSTTSHEFILQDIVCRSTSLTYITVISSFTCSKMRPDGFGGMAVLITADRVTGKSTYHIIEDLLREEVLILEASCPTARGRIAARGEALKGLDLPD